MFSWFKHSNHEWGLRRHHKTWRIRNHPINIDDKYILYSTDFNVGEDGIVMYDIIRDKFDIIKYPMDIKPEYHSYCRYKDDYIYMINGDGSITVFDITKRTFERIADIKNQQTIGRYSSCMNIEGSDFIHIFGGTQNQHHLIYWITKNVYILNRNFGVKLENPSVLYLEYQQRILIFSAYSSSSFFVGNIVNNKDEQFKIKWEVSTTLYVPHKLRDCGYVLYKNKFILIFGGCNVNKVYSDHIYLINLMMIKKTLLN